MEIVKYTDVRSASFYGRYPNCTIIIVFAQKCACGNNSLLSNGSDFHKCYMFL